MLTSKNVIKHKTTKQNNIVIFYCHNSDAVMGGYLDS